MLQDHINETLSDGSETLTDEQKADKLIEKCGYASAALTIIPIPGSEIIAVMPIHVAMVTGIGSIYDCEVSQNSAIKLVMEILTTAGISLVGSRIAITTSKILLPGLGGLIGAPFIFASTIAIGAVAKIYFKNEGNIDKNDIKSIYKESSKKARKNFDKNKMQTDEAKKMAEAATEQNVQPPGEKVMPDSEKVSTTERLEQLKELLDKDLIEQSEYDEVKKKILSDI